MAKSAPRNAGGPGRRADATSVAFIQLERPLGSVVQAFETQELAAWIVEFYGAAAGVALVRETELPAPLLAELESERVVVYRTGRDYNGATLEDPSFPWADRVIRYDPRSAAARGVGKSACCTASRRFAYEVSGESP